MQVLKVVRIHERLLFPHYQSATNLHIYTLDGSYVVVDDAVYYIDTPPYLKWMSLDIAFTREDKSYYVFLTDNSIVVSRDKWRISAELSDETQIYCQMYVKNVQHDGDITRLTAWTEEIIVDLLINWSRGNK